MICIAFISLLIWCVCGGGGALTIKTGRGSKEEPQTPFLVHREMRPHIYPTVVKWRIFIRSIFANRVVCNNLYVIRYRTFIILNNSHSNQEYYSNWTFSNNSFQRSLPALISRTCPFPILGELCCIFQCFFFSFFYRTFQTVKILIKHRIMWYLVWVCIVWLCPIKDTIKRLICVCSIRVCLEMASKYFLSPFATLSR